MTESKTTRLNDAQDFVLCVLDDHGPCRFSAGADLTACEFLFANGYISDLGDGTKQLTAKGKKYLEREYA